MSDVRAVFTQDSVLAAVAGDAAAIGNSGSLEELIQAYVNAAIASIGAGALPWSVIDSAVPLMPGNGYAVNGLSLINLSLPAAPANSRLILYAYSAAGFRVQQPLPTDQIQVGDKFTTLGMSGRIEAIGQSAIELVRLPNRWIGTILQGNFEVI